ncbi:MAG: hypothetical protein BMS9Abin03_356 [Thermodesulfobacteriota bacterium]|nr:MAG: hypothetical protein BMS9Abin03_356 [Thermodesulfobacteriota bacterium]
MKGDRIPDPDHISRSCRPMQAPEGQIQATAFMLRLDEEYLSVNWLEYFDCSSRVQEINEIRNVYAEKLNVGKRAKIAILNVGEIREKVLTESPDKRNIEVLHSPIENDVHDPSHGGIYNLKQDDELIAELILETVHETHSARP